MNNTVTYENPIRLKLKKAMAILVVLAIVFAVILVLINLINNQTYNGKTVQVSGVVKSVQQPDDTIYLYLDNSDVRYSANPIDDRVDNLDALVGKSVIFFLPEKQFGNGDPLIFGLIVDGVEVVNAKTVLDEMHHDNVIVVIVMAVLCGLCAATVCALGIARTYLPREKVYPLGQKYVEFYAEKQPNCPEMRYLKIFSFAWTMTWFALLMMMSIWNSIEEQSNLFNWIFVGVIGGIVVMGLVGFIPLKKWLDKKNLEFYANHYPFDFADISHVRMKKALREQIEKEMREDLLLHPHYQGDGGNGYMARFTDAGVELYVPDFVYNEQEQQLQEPHIDVPAEDVFSLPATDSETTATQTAATTDQGPDRPPVITLTYDELNFQAVPYFRKPRPLFVVIKSRLTKKDDYPEELVNDLHFLLDVNLLKTLQTFSVPVDGLDNILENKRELMLNAYQEKKTK